MSKQPIAYNYMGGVRTDLPLTEYPAGTALRALNCRLSRSGKVGTRFGAAKYHDDQIATAPIITGLHHFLYGAAGDKFLECAGANVYTNDGTTRASIKAGQTAGKYYSFADFDNFCWICNGQDVNLKYDGAAVTNACIVTPVVGAMAAADSGAAGNVTGQVSYLATFYVTATGQESQPFILSTAPGVNVVNKKVDLTDIPVSADTQVTARRIYRTTAGGSLYNAQLVTSIGDNATTTYQDNTLDANLGALIELDHDPAPVFAKWIVHLNRGWGFEANSSRLYFSKEYNFWYWPQGVIDRSTYQRLFFIDIDPDDGDFITNVVELESDIIVFKKNSVHVVTGYDETDFQRRKLQFGDRVGCVGKRAAVVANNLVHFLDNSGIYSTNGQQIAYSGKPVEGFFDPENITIENKVNGAYLADAVAIVDNSRPNSLMTFSVPADSDAVNSFHINFNFAIEDPVLAWTYDDGYIAQSYAAKTVSSRDFIIRGDDFGITWTQNQNDGFEGVAVNSTATSGAATSLTDSTLTLTPDACIGLYIYIRSGKGEGQSRRITDNDATSFTVAAWTTVPDSTSVYTVGGIHFVYQTRWENYGNQEETKRLNWIRPLYDTTGNYDCTIYFLWDFQTALSESMTTATASPTTWDGAYWDGIASYWDSIDVSQTKTAPPANHIHRWSSVRWDHYKAGEPVRMNGWATVFQNRGAMR